MLPNPENTSELSSIPVKGLFTIPLRNNLLYDYEWGGVALNDTSQGLYYRLWKLSYNKLTYELSIKRADSSESTVLLTIQDITRVGLAFDFNMNPQIIYEVAGQTYFYWYDPALAAYTTIVIPDAKNACISLDDARDIAAGLNDILLVYQKETGLYYRRQRDRYQVEYFLTASIPENVKLHQVGMNNKMRFQFMFKG